MTGDRLSREARDGTLLVFAANGFALASWMSRVPDVKELLELSPGLLSVLLLSVSVGSLIGLPVSGRITNRIGAANTVRIGVVLVVVGILLAGIAAQSQISMYLVMPGLFLFGLGSGVWDVAQNFQGTIVERAISRAIMPWFHAGFSAGTVLGAAAGALILWARIPMVVHLGVAVGLVGFAGWWGSTRFLNGFDDTESDAVPATGGQPSAWLEPRTVLIGVMVMAAAFTEGTANDWLAVAFVDGHQLDASLGVVALAVFLSFMTAGRILGTWVLDRYGRVLVLRILFSAAIIGCAMVVFGNTVVAFCGAAIWGLGASLGFPVGMSAAADDPTRAPLRISVVSTIGYTAFLAGPPVLGLLGDQVGVLRSLLLVGAVSVLAILVVPVARPLEVEPEREPG